MVSYAGFDVVERESGTSTGKTRISKKGNSRIRRILHLPAFNVIRFKQTAFVNLYERVYGNTKMKMKAYVAVQKKILVIIYALWKKDEAFQIDFNQKETSGNEEHRVLFPFFVESQNTSGTKTVVPPYSSTTQDEHRYNESHEVLFP